MNLPPILVSPGFALLFKWTCLLTLGWIIHLALRRRHARWRVILWRGILCIGVALPLLYFFQVPRLKIPININTADVAEFTGSPSMGSIAGSTQPVTLPAMHPAPASLAPTPLSSSAKTLPSPTLSRPISWGGILVAVWVLGCVVGAFRLVRLQQQLSLLQKSCRPAPGLRQLARQIQDRLEVRREIEVQISDAVTSPFVCGLLKPVIILPQPLAQKLSPGELSALLNHEIAHLRQHDLVWCVAWRWMKAVCWFHPLVWQVPSVHSLACEQEADRIASGQLADSETYSQLLARLALRVLALPAVETKLTLNGSSQIVRRLNHLAQRGLGVWNWRHTATAAGLVGMLFLMTAGCDFSRTNSDSSTAIKPTSSSQLLQKFEAALKAKNKDAILALYNSEGVSEWMKSGLADNVDDWLTRDVKGVNLSPLPAGFSSTGQHEEVRFHLNVKPVGVIEAHFTDGFGIGMPYGKKGDVFYIAGVVTEQIPVPENATNKSVTIYVRTADGKPIPHIVVGSGAPNAIPILHLKALYGGADQFFTDIQGSLSLPQAATNLFLVVANSRGFGWLPNGNLTNGAILVVQPWTRIEGTWKNRNQPVAGEKLSLSIPPALYAVRPVRIGGVETRTDVNGHFVFTNVPPLKMEIQRFGKQGTGAEIFGSAIASIEVNGGGTMGLEIDTHGRTVLGKVTIGKGLDTNIDLADCSGQFEPASRNLDHLYFQASSNGCFEEDFVEPGDYTVNGSIDSDGKHVALLDSISVHVPDDPPDAADAPFDMGAVTLNATVNLKSGDTAPDFATTTVEGQPLKLSDLRGKYVLLDFWATWCGPCVGETPNLKATYDAFGNDKRFTMVSLSLDAEREAPQKFARNHDIAWVQGFLGDWSHDKLTSKYGVYGIPSIFLIGPDGKILATDLRGPKIKEAVAAALGR